MAPSSNDNRRIAVRGAKFRALVLDATIARIEKAGIDHIRIAEVAKDAGVHETSIYRRWKTLPRLLLDALISRTTAEIPLPDTGSLRWDLEVHTANLARFAQTPVGTALLRGVVVSDTDPEVAAGLREFWEQRISAAEKLIERGKERGEVAPDVDARLVMLTLGGLIHIYATHLRGEMPSNFSDRAVALLLTGIAPSAAKRP
jgi:AcrR family transcriptional regulator